MKTLLIRVGLQLGTSAVAIILAALILPGFHLRFSGFLTAVIIFTIVQSLATGIVEKIANKHAPVLSGAASLISTFLALLIANGFGGGTSIRTFTSWVLATLIVWAVTAAGAVFLPRLLLKGAAK
ncbi:phage holin family protein [Arthrobacter sp. GMC3]|uniref:phage holin family protein n=1 Tax=Arthrobacter sp. GMC3 TaxID=2058894 RepID=UPI000CE4B19F|nr:phage holin family protein [Arthrobacter sp. GMC3]